MRASRWLAQLAAVAMTLGVAGCAVGSSPSSPHVSLNISAPTAGATVGVHQVTVTGNVQPLTATVNVNGHPAHVAGGVYSQTVNVSSVSQKITVVAAAHGFAGAQATTTVGYSPSTAAQLMASTKTLKSQPAAVTAKLARSSASRAINAMFNIPTPGTGGHKPKPAPSGSGTTGSGTTSSPSRGTPTGGSTSAGGSSTGSTGNTSSTPPSPPPPTPQQIARAIRKAWVHGCIPHRKGENVGPYCTCTYTQLQHHNNLLSTQAGVTRWNHWIRPYLRTGDFTKLPRFVQRAVEHCINKYPPLDPLSGKSSVKPLPGGSHGGAPASNQPVTPVSGQPPTPSVPSAPTSSTSTTSSSDTTSTTSTSSQITTGGG
jgi:hypothetical protein